MTERQYIFDIWGYGDAPLRYPPAMGPYSAEVTIHRIGGPDRYPPDQPAYYWARDYQGQVPLGPSSQHDVYGVYRPMDLLRVVFDEVDRVEDAWLAGRLILATMNGHPIGRTPVPFMVYALPWDIPTWSHIIDPWLGHYSVGIRLTGTALDLSKAAAEDAEQRAHAELHADAYQAGERATAEQGEQG